MQNDVLRQIKDKLSHDLEQCKNDKKEIKAQGLFSQSDVILGRATEIKELLEYLEGLEEPATTDISQLYYEEKICTMLDHWLGACEDNEQVIKNIKIWLRCEWVSSFMDISTMNNLMERVDELAFKKIRML